MSLSINRMLGPCGALPVGSFPHHRQLSAHFTDEGEESWERFSDLPKIMNHSDINTGLHGLIKCLVCARPLLIRSRASATSSLRANPFNRHYFHL